MNNIQIVYTSKARSDVNDAQIINIHSKALSNNVQKGITGMLLYTKGTFLQVIEGEADIIDRLMETIKSDTRHHDVEILVRNSIKHREFKNWSMGYRRLDDGDAKALLNFAPFFEDGFDAKRFCEQPGIALDILKALASQFDEN
jgi:DNA-binding transcriptional regulator WhiA